MISLKTKNAISFAHYAILFENQKEQFKYTAW